MEIIHLILGKANPNRLNGVNKVVYQLATEQEKSNKNIAVWGISNNLDHDYPERNFKTTLFKSHINPFKIDSILKKQITTHKNAVFHLHGGWIPVYYSLALLFQKHNIKYVLTPHGAYNTVAMERSSIKKKIYFQLFEKHVLKYAHKLHAIGESEVQGLNSIFKNNKSLLLPYGFIQPPSSTNKAKSSNFIIGFVGRIDVYTKGLDVLLEAFHLFQKKEQDSELWIIGDGEEMSYLEKFIAENSIKNITLFGKKFGDEKNELIQKMSVFAHPSRNEGLPTSVLEAASFGVPSIVTVATNVASYIDKYTAGLSIEKTNTDLLYHAFIDMKEKVKHISYADNCSKMLKDEFCWESLVNEYDKLYS